MKRKIYTAIDRVYLRKVLFIDGNETVAEFTGGTINGKKVFGGTYSTSDRKIQDAIEASDYFKSKRISLGLTVDLKGEAESVKISSGDKNGSGDGKVIREFPGVTNAQKAKEVLISDFSVDAEDVEGRPNAVIIGKAKEVGASFPDWAAFNS